MSTKFITRMEFAARLGLSEASFERLRKRAPDFPKEVRFLTWKVQFVEAEVDEFIARRIAERDGAKAA